MAKIKYLFVINPISGGNDKSAFSRFIEEENQRQGFTFEIYKTSGVDDESTLKKLVRKHKPNVIIAVGGDGTLLLVAKVAKNSAIKIGLIPFGSANGMSKELNIPKIPDIKLSLDPSERFKDCWHIIKNERATTY